MPLRYLKGNIFRSLGDCNLLISVFFHPFFLLAFKNCFPFLTSMDGRMATYT